MSVISFNETVSVIAYDNHQFSVNLPTEQFLSTTICAMWQILFQEFCYVLVVFKVFPCGRLKNAKFHSDEAVGNSVACILGFNQSHS